MSTQICPIPQQIDSPELEVALARQSRQALSDLIHHRRKVALSVHAEGSPSVEIALPPSLSQVLLDALEKIGKGKDVTIVSTDTELTTQRAADLARVSRPFLIKLLEEGQIPYRKVGAHRRILYRDVAFYLEKEEARRIRVMEELVAETERLGLYE